jgi:signal transduction histidine kinase/CheY-like chemotaxis protein
MDLMEELTLERQGRKLAQSERCAKRQQIASFKETMSRQVQNLTDQINQQGPFVAQAVTWAERLLTARGPVAHQKTKAHLDALLAARRPQAHRRDPIALDLCPTAVTPAVFLAHIAHDLSTPLGGVVGMADLLCNTALTAEQRLFADTIKSAASAALALTHDILEYAKITAQGVLIKAEPFDLEGLIHDLTTLLQPAASAKGISLLVEYDPSLPRQFTGDAGRIRQVLTNLLGNAVKFTGQGQVLIRVTGLQAGEGSHQVHITVEDTGIGIAPDDLALIFEAFHQATPNAGLGLGLAFAKRLVERMGGAIWVDSELGQGSRFGLRLPLPVADTPVVPSDLPSLPQDAGPPRSMRILVAEDNRTNQLVFQKMVRDLAVNVVFANNGAEAVSLFQTFQPDLIFMDIAMPQMDGCQAALAIRQIEAGQQHLPIIALTALMGEGDTAALVAAGIDRHMTKPLHKAALREVMIAFCPKAAFVLPPAVELASAGA